MSGTTIGRFVLITGATAAGKTTAGRALASLLPRAVHVDGGDVQGFVVSGAVAMDVPPKPEAVEQLMLRYAAAMAVASVYRKAGFDAIVTDNVFEAHLLGLLFTAFADLGTEPVHVVVLDPHLDVIAERYRARPGGGYTETMTPTTLTAALHRTPRLGLWLDTSAQSPTETAAAILDRLEEAAVTQHDLLRQLNAPSGT